MTRENAPVTIKKYANRRLYNTGTSAYVTLEDLATMVKKGEDFVVFDAKNGEDITRAVLGQIIFEQESKSGQSLLPTTFLRQLIRFYGDSMQMLVPSYLEFSLDKLVSEKNGFRAQCGDAFGVSNPFATVTRPMFEQIEEQTRNNMAMFRQALSLFPAFGTQEAGATAATAAPPVEPPATPASVQSGQARQEFDDMKRQLEELQRRIEGLAPKN